MYSHQHGSLVSYETWLTALASSACIGFTSLVPWLFNLTFFEHHKHNKEAGQKEDGRMKFLLSFAVGAILGDIFFHLIPESLQSHIIELNDSRITAHKKVGLSIIAGIFMFIIVEMLLEKWSHSMQDGSVSIQGVLENESSVQVKQRRQSIDQVQAPKQSDLKQAIGLLVNYDSSKETFENNNNNDNNNISLAGKLKDFHPDEYNNLLNMRKKDFVNNNPTIYSIFTSDNTISTQKIGGESILHKKVDKGKLSNGAAESTLPFIPCSVKSINDDHSLESTCKVIDVAGYLNLIANGFDNFTHGLAIGASFLVGPKVGLLTTFVIFIHEIPHEICDYAILVNSGFSRWDAVKAQSSVSLFGILGTALALYVKSVQTLNAKTVWILPFSAGGFLYIALVNLLPEILDPKVTLSDSVTQIACVILGIAFMAIVAVI